MHKMNHDRQKLYDAIDALESEALVFGRRFINDSRVRARYKIDIGKYGNEILFRVESGQISTKEGAKIANMLRNQIMDASRIKTSDIANAIAKSYKKHGLTMSALQEQDSSEMYQNEFAKLSDIQKREVWVSIIKSSMRTSKNYDQLASKLSHTGRALMITAIILALYKILKAKNKVHETAKQGIQLTTASEGSEIGGTIGAFGGPLDIVTIPLGVFLGGLIGYYTGKLITTSVDKVSPS